MLLAAASAAREGTSVLATSAALVAAGASVAAVAVGVFNVIRTAQFAAERELDAWRRNVVYPLVAAVNAASYNHSGSVGALVALRQRGVDAEYLQDLRAEASAAFTTISDRLAELEVAAPEMEMFLAQAQLRTAHLGLSIFEDSPEQAQKLSEDVQTIRREFLAAAHAVLGIETKPRRRWWRRIQRWSQQRIRRWRPSRRDS
jgi:hypothetical protein